MFNWSNKNSITIGSAFLLDTFRIRSRVKVGPSRTGGVGGATSPLPQPQSANLKEIETKSANQEL